MEIIRATYGMQYHLYFVALEGIPLLSDVSPENIGCWELSLNLSLMCSFSSIRLLSYEGP
jgi:hypothetical protein